MISKISSFSQTAVDVWLVSAYGIPTLFFLKNLVDAVHERPAQVAEASYADDAKCDPTSKRQQAQFQAKLALHSHILAKMRSQEKTSHLLFEGRMSQKHLIVIVFFFVFQTFPVTQPRASPFSTWRRTAGQRPQWWQDAIEHRCHRCLALPNMHLPKIAWY